jgi:hypothetical protein
MDHLVSEKRGDDKCFGVLVSLKRRDEKCSSYQVVVRIGGEITLQRYYIFSFTFIWKNSNAKATQWLCYSQYFILYNLNK